MNPDVRSLILDIFTLLGGKIESRKKLHKIIYILTSNGLHISLNYTFGLYGPYSSELDSLLYTLVEDGIIKTERRDDGITVYHLTIPRRLAKTLDKPYTKLVQALANFAPWELEIISTILYFNPEADERECIDIVNNVKPEKFSPEAIRNAWNNYLKIIKSI